MDQPPGHEQARGLAAPHPLPRADLEPAALLPYFAASVAQRARLLEVVGAFLLGGGVVAVGYELMAGLPEAEAQGGEPTEATESHDGAVAALDEAEPEASEGIVAAGLPAGTRPGNADDSASGDGVPWLVANAEGTYKAFPLAMIPPIPMTPEEEAEFPKHGLVTSVAAIVRSKPDLESPILGLLRGGTRVRTDAELTYGGGCTAAWHEIHPGGWVCRSAGLETGDTPPSDATVSVPEPQLDQELPYEYWRVNDEMTPFFHRLPSFGEQDQADAAGQAWYAKHGREPMPTDPAERPADVPAVVKEYMNAGYYVTKAGEEMKSQRRFIRTTRGAYARKYQLGQKESPSFRGRLLPGGAEDLPLYFIRRELALQQREAEGSDVLVDSGVVPERLSTHPFVREIHLGPKEYYEDADGRLMRAYAVGKARLLDRPPGVGADEHWVHIDLSEQTLVAYDGDTPVFATLVSSGKEPGMTPVGVHRIQIKHIAAPMRDQPPEDEAYSIDDVPWTQYFHGSIALHGAFWHAGFGLERSHGCVNLSPADARWLFGFTQPSLPYGWHAYAPLQRKQKGSPVVVTE